MLLQKQIYAPEINVPSLIGLVLKPLVDGAKFIKMETCTQCKKTKEETEFHKQGNGIRSKCKKCSIENVKIYFLKDPQKTKQRARIQYLKNRNRTLKEQREWRKNNPKEANAWRKNNPEEAKKRDKINYWKFKTKILERAKKNRIKNRKKRNRQLRERKQNDPLFKIRGNLSRRAGRAFKQIGSKKYKKTEILLGVSFSIAKSNIENQFTEGMNWKNYGRKKGIKCWEIDHIIPLASAKTIDELILLCHYTNLQPLWMEDNRSKQSKIVETQIKMAI